MTPLMWRRYGAEFLGTFAYVFFGCGARIVVENALSHVWIYWVGPLLGAVLGAIVYEALRGGNEHAIEAPEGIFQSLRKPKIHT